MSLSGSDYQAVAKAVGTAFWACTAVFFAVFFCYLAAERCFYLHPVDGGVLLRAALWRRGLIFFGPAGNIICVYRLYFIYLQN
jgi:hypothetical protein